MRALSAWLQANHIEFHHAGLASDLVADSRRVEPGAVFVALAGRRTDGGHYVEEAERRGAVCILSEHAIAGASIPVVVIADLRKHLPVLAATFFDRPSADLNVVGITGTNGKTTTAQLVEAILRAGSLEPGVLGTLNYRFGETVMSAPNTTPDAVTVQWLFERMKRAGCASAVLEVSSHALAEARVDEVQFDVAVFTNLTRDHLDYHADMNAYYAAKSRLFLELLPRSGKDSRAVVNVDDPYGARLALELTVPKWTVGFDTADFQIGAPNLHPNGFEVDIHSPFGMHRLECRLPGRHNIYNAVQALAAGLALGVEPAVAEKALASVEGVPGRLEHFTAGGIHAYVDYAHTDDALASVLDSMRAFARGRVLTVFGCGGDRDRGKRPFMGSVAAQRSDVLILTSDNPRTEDPLAILADIEAGVREAGMARFDGERGYWVEPERAKAIGQAIKVARPGDVVLIAGKGHEDYQILGEERIAFDDRVEVRRALHEMEAS